MTKSLSPIMLYYPIVMSFVSIGFSRVVPWFWSRWAMFKKQKFEYSKKFFVRNHHFEQVIHFLSVHCFDRYSRSIFSISPPTCTQMHIDSPNTHAHTCTLTHNHAHAHTCTLTLTHTRICPNSQTHAQIHQHSSIFFLSFSLIFYLLLTFFVSLSFHVFTASN